MEVEDRYSQQLQGVEGFNELNKVLHGTKDGQYSFSNRTAAIKNAEAYIWSALTIKERQRLDQMKRKLYEDAEVKYLEIDHVVWEGLKRDEDKRNFLMEMLW